MDIAPHSPHAQDAIAPHLTVLGIESSCDETAASIVRRHADGRIDVLSSIIASQDDQHAPFGGVVPELAARAHIAKIDGITENAMSAAGIEYDALDAVAATAGPGLIGGVIAGLMTAKGLALSLGIPLIGINHLEGHALSPRLASPCPFPYLLLLVSGGHTQLLSVSGLGQYKRLGSTVDDAAGEAFDKTAKVMSLGFPGGPALERLAKKGNDRAIKLPRPFAGKDHADFSFAGLKTAALRAYQALGDNPNDAKKADLAASFQRACADILCERSGKAMDMFLTDRAETHKPHRFVVAGGVAANKTIRAALQDLCSARGFDMFLPPFEFCTDNAAMIALAGVERLAIGDIDDLSVPARPRWPLDADSAKLSPASGSGKKGPKS